MVFQGVSQYFRASQRSFMMFSRVSGIFQGVSDRFQEVFGAIHRVSRCFWVHFKRIQVVSGVVGVAIGSNGLRC